MLKFEHRHVLGEYSRDSATTTAAHVFLHQFLSFGSMRHIVVAIVILITTDHLTLTILELLLKTRDIMLSAPDPPTSPFVPRKLLQVKRKVRQEMICRLLGTCP